ncbi:PAS domain S-box protein, partial [Patescibacteria group bacterium]|nr:PAS domain S-box protein [Patescibacteria group bacterium]
RNLTFSAALDFVFPSIKSENPNIGNIYIIGDEYGWYRLYPNSDPDPEKRGGFVMDVLPADLNKEGVDPVFWDNLDEFHNPDKKAKWTPPYVDVTGQGLMVSVLAPVYQNNKMIAVAGMDVSLEDISNRILDIKLWETGYAFMIDSRGRPISFPVRARPDLEWGEESLEISKIREFSLLNVKNEQLRNVVKEMIDGTHVHEPRIVKFGQTEKYIVAHQIQNTGWSLALVVPVNEVLGSALATRNFIFIVLGIITLILVVLVFFTSRLVTAPIKELTKGALEISKGNLDYQIKIKTKDEIQELAQGFNEMARRLKVYYATLEQKVKDRTNELALAKNRIEQEKNRIEAILISMADGVFVVDTQGRLALLNPAVKRITGFEEKDCLGQPYNQVLKFLTEKEKKENIAFMQHALQTGELSKMTNHTVLITKNGKEIPVACSAAAIKDEKGIVVGAVGAFRDITKEREVEKIKSEFVSLASHQLRTPVTIIKWGAETLLKSLGDKLKKKDREQVDRIYRGSNRMIELVNDLLNVSRLEGGRLVFKRDEIQFEELIDKVVEEYKPYLEKKNVKVSVTKPEELMPKISIDLEKIRQVVIILLDNAIKYSPEGSEIKIKFEQRGKELFYSNADQGVGIPKGQQEKIFSRFFRADNVSQKPGTGLGLYLAKGLIEAHGGKIWFSSEGGSGESEENKGTTFFFTLPCKKENSK